MGVLRTLLKLTGTFSSVFPVEGKEVRVPDVNFSE
jgi:hypothetical protein